MTPEGKVKALVKKVLSSHEAYYHMPVQSGLGAPTLDFIGCHKGRYFAIETKAPGKKPTERQMLTMGAIRDAGGAVFVVDGETSLATLEQWLVK